MAEDTLPNEIPILRRDAIMSAVAFAGQQFLRGSESWDHVIGTVLERLGSAAGVERVYIFEDRTSPEGRTVSSLRYEWTKPGGARLLHKRGLQNTPYFSNSTRRWREQLREGKVVTGNADDQSPAIRKVLQLLLVHSFAAVPIFVSGNWWGTLGMADNLSVRQWSDLELDALKIAASMLGAAFERQRIIEERAENERFLSLMSRLSAVALESEGEKALLAATVEQLPLVIRADFCAILTWNEANDEIAVAAATPNISHFLSTLGRQFAVDLFATELLYDRRTMAFNDPLELPPRLAAIVRQIPATSGLAMPMVTQNKVLGTVMLGFGEKHHITRAEQERIELATRQLAQFLFNARLLAAETLARQQAETLQAVGQAIGSTLNLREVLERILSELQRVVPYDSASVQRLEGSQSVVIAGRGFDDDQQRVGLSYDITDPSLPNKTIYEHLRSVSLADVSSTYHGFSSHDDSPVAIRSWLGVPLLFGGRAIGMLTLDKTEAGFYTAGHARLAESFATQAAIALENARLFEVTRLLNTQIWRQAEQLRQVIDTVDDGIVLLDAGKSIVLANSTFYTFLPALTGKARALTLETVCGLPVERLLEQDSGVGWHEVPALGRENRIFAISVNPVSIGPDAGGLVLSISDVTREREQRQKLTAQERLATIGALAGRVAHEFNNILQGIIGFADLLSKDPDIPPAARHRLGLMAREGQRGADLIRLIVEYSREVPIDLRPLDLAALVAGAEGQLAAAAGCPVVVAVSPEPIYTVNGDAVRLLMALTTLAKDAAATLSAEESPAVRVFNHAVTQETAAGLPGGRQGLWACVEISGGWDWFSSPEHAYALQHDLPLGQMEIGRDIALAQVQGVIRQHRGAITIRSLPDGRRSIIVALPAAMTRNTLISAGDPLVERKATWQLSS